MAPCEMAFVVAVGISTLVGCSELDRAVDEELAPDKSWRFTNEHSFYFSKGDGYIKLPNELINLAGENARCVSQAPMEVVVSDEKFLAESSPVVWSIGNRGYSAEGIRIRTTVEGKILPNATPGKKQVRCEFPMVREIAVKTGSIASTSRYEVYDGTISISFNVHSSSARMYLKRGGIALLFIALTIAAITLYSWAKTR